MKRGISVDINSQINLYFNNSDKQIWIDIIDRSGYSHPAYVSYAEFEEMIKAYNSLGIPERTTIDSTSESHLM